MSKYTRRGRLAHTQLNFGMPRGRVGKAVLRALGGYVPRGGEVLELDVEHDDWCPHLRGGACPRHTFKSWWRAKAGAVS